MRKFGLSLREFSLSLCEISLSLCKSGLCLCVQVWFKFVQVCFKFGGHMTSLPRVTERATRSAWTPCLTLVSLPEHGRTLEKVVADGARRSGSKSNLTSLKSL